MRTEDGHIINKCLDGDSAAFGFLVDKYKASVYAWAYSRLRNFHDAEDISQEVFIKAYQKLHTLKRWDNFLAWLYAITSNKCKNFIRSKCNRPDREFVEDQDASIFDPPSLNSYQDGLVRESLHEALDSLPETYQEVLTLYYLGGMSSKEIAQFLGTSPDTVRQRLSRARAKLKKEMLDMMSTTYEGQRLQPNFTFHIVEMVKQMRVQPMPRLPWGLPWGLSAATGLVLLTVLSFTPYLISLTPFGTLLGSPMPSETKVMEEGELPVDVLEISEITFLSSEQDGKDGAKKLPDNAFAPPLAPSGKGDTWARKVDMLTPRVSPSASAVGGKIYVIGGARKGGTLSKVEACDTATDTWTEKSDMPTPRWHLRASVVNGKIYAIGGWLAINPLVPTAAVEEYEPVTDTWTKKADMPTARIDLSTSAVNGKIYAIGGAAPRGDGGFNHLSTVEEYNPVTDTWTKKADMPTPRGIFSTSVVNGKIYAIGGYNGAFLPTVEAYDPVTNSWTRKADMPTARSNLSAGTVNGKIYAIGGLPIPGFSNALSVVEEYDTGLVFNSINPAGKSLTTWGGMKAEK